jgi:hypothetical protein
MLALFALASACATASTEPSIDRRPALIVNGHATVKTIDGQPVVPRRAKGLVDTGFEVQPGRHTLGAVVWIYRRIPPLLVQKQLVPYGPIEVCLDARPGRRYTVDAGTTGQFPPPIIIEQGSDERVDRACGPDVADE